MKDLNSQRLDGKILEPQQHILGDFYWGEEVSDFAKPVHSD